jgi:flavin reductase (DIM6/NTAB) family NADH-FMN oxidoreductase RutF
VAKTLRDLHEGLWALPGFPVVLVTVDRNVMTAAAFSFYSFDPPCVMVGIRPQTWTFDLISEKRQFGINLPTKEQIELARYCGAVSGRDEDKFARDDLTAQEAEVIDGVLVAECPVSIECSVVHEVEFGGTHRWFVGQIEAVHIDEAYTPYEALMFWWGQYRAMGEMLLDVRSG